MNAEESTILLNLVLALLAGGLIGLERSFRGRAAGFRTYALVCLASAVLMVLTVHQAGWLPATAEQYVLDPTRMAQGIMTGIGFLGAGVIVKSGASLRGLTSAASIWVTAAIGILVGVGFYWPAAVATALTLGTLSVFQWVESRLPTQTYAQFMVRFSRDQVMPQEELRALIGKLGFTVDEPSYRLNDHGRAFEYRMVIRTLHRERLHDLAEAMRAVPAVIEFRISPRSE